MSEHLINVIVKALKGDSFQVAQAHLACDRYKATGGKPLETGNNIRCLFSMGENSGFAWDKFKFTEGSVYVVSGTSVDSRDRMIDKLKECGLDVESAEHMMNPESPRPFYLARRRDSEDEVLFTYPGFPGVVLDVVMDGAVDETQNKDIQVGQQFTPERLTCLAVDITVGKTYTITSVDAPCGCDDDDCPAKDIRIATFIDDAGDEVNTEIPFGPYGTLRLID